MMTAAQELTLDTIARNSELGRPTREQLDLLLKVRTSAGANGFGVLEEEAHDAYQLWYRGWINLAEKDRYYRISDTGRRVLKALFG